MRWVGIFFIPFSLHFFSFQTLHDFCLETIKPTTEPTLPKLVHLFNRMLGSCLYQNVCLQNMNTPYIQCDCYIVSLSICGFDAFHLSSFLLFCLFNSLSAFNHFQFVGILLLAATAWKWNSLVLPPFFLFGLSNSSNKIQGKKWANEQTWHYYFTSMFFARLESEMMLILNVHHQKMKNYHIN